LRKRIEQKIRKRLRRTRKTEPELVAAVQKYERSGVSLASALNLIALDHSADWRRRGSAAKLLALAGERGVNLRLLDLFFTQTDKIELWETALTIEQGGLQAAVPRLIGALNDSNLDRRHAAARALGWIWPVGTRAAKALIGALLDKSQPQPVREEAAESLAYSRYAPAIPPLISVLDEFDTRMRFWAVFALGGIGQWCGQGSADRHLIEALKRMLPDAEVPPGNWWAVGKEALAMLAKLDPQHRAILDSETRRVLNDPNSSPEDLRWAEGYRWFGNTKYRP
jgi:HEAT repeat protein